MHETPSYGIKWSRSLCTFLLVIYFHPLCPFCGMIYIVDSVSVHSLLKSAEWLMEPTSFCFALQWTSPLSKRSTQAFSCSKCGALVRMNLPFECAFFDVRFFNPRSPLYSRGLSPPWAVQTTAVRPASSTYVDGLLHVSKYSLRLAALANPPW